MTGAMYAAISGLKAHMNKLNVIGNNIANVNTYGYKTGRTVFETALYTSMRTGSNGTAVVGGRNPSQIGYGAQIGSIDLDMSTGTYAPTGKPTDCMIAGDGFFMVGSKDVAGVIDPYDPNSLKSVTLSRVGNFEFKADGYLTDGAGNVVYGFLTIGTNPDGTPIVSDQLVPIRYPKFSGDKVTVDDDGNETVIPGEGVKYPTEGDPAIADDDETKDKTLIDAFPTDADGNPTGEAYPFAQFDSITIDEVTGKISGTCKDTDEQITIGYIGMANVTNPNGVTQMSGSYYKCGDGGSLTVSLMGGAAEDLGIRYVNGSLWAAPDDAEEGAAPPDGMRIGSAGTTRLYTGGLEMSKTDLATEISEMITTQRGYQANTRIITVTDAMLEELVNIKR